MQGKARLADVRAGVQQMEITVKGGHAPNLIRVRQGVPVRLVFDRRESGNCTSQVLSPEDGGGSAAHVEVPAAVC